MQKWFSFLIKSIGYLSLFATTSALAVAPQPSEKLGVKLNTQETHLQYKSLLLTNNENLPVSLQWQLSDTLKGKVQICTQGDKRCDFQTTCSTNLAPNSSCTLWLKSIDNNNNSLGNTLGQARTIMTDTNHKTVMNYYNIQFHNVLYAVGAVSPQMGGILLRWDGQKWQPLAPGMGGAISSLVIFKGDLIVGGDFGMVEHSKKVNAIARWDGNQWYALGTGVTEGPYPGWVGSLVVYKGHLIAGGAITNAGSIPANYIAQWDGSQWSALGVGVNSYVRTLYIDNGNLIVGGDFTQAGGYPINYIASWNGASWSALGQGTGLNIGMHYGVKSIAIFNNHLIVQGRFSAAGGKPANNIAQWDGTQWSPLGNGIKSTDSYRGALLNFNGNLIVGTQGGGEPANNISQWNGTQWSALGNGLGTGEGKYVYVGALTVINGRLIAGGQFDHSNPHFIGIAQWNGSQWVGVGMDPGFSPGETENFLTVSSLAISNQSSKK